MAGTENGGTGYLGNKIEMGCGSNGEPKYVGNKVQKVWRTTIINEQTRDSSFKPFTGIFISVFLITLVNFVISLHPSLIFEGGIPIAAAIYSFGIYSFGITIRLDGLYGFED